MKKETPIDNKMSLPVGTVTEVQDISANQSTEPVFICDECGDTMWDAVLAQEGLSNALGNACPIPSTISGK